MCSIQTNAEKHYIVQFHLFLLYLKQIEIMTSHSLLTLSNLSNPISSGCFLVQHYKAMKICFTLSQNLQIFRKMTIEARHYWKQYLSLYINSTMLNHVTDDK